LSSKDQVVDTLIRALEADNEVHRCFAAHALGRLGNRKAVAALMEHVQDMDLDVALDSIEALGLLGDPAPIPLLLEGFNLADVPDIKVNAADAIGRLGGPEVVDELIKALRLDLDMVDGDGWDASWNINHIAVEALGRIGDARAVTPLASMLDDDTVVEEEGNILSALIRCGEEGVSVVTTRLREHKMARSRRHAAMALSHVDAAVTRDALAEALLDEDGDVRIYAARSLAGFKDKAHLIPLFMLLRDQNAEVRREAVQLVADLGGERTVEKILPLLEDKNVGVRVAAARVLGGLHVNDAVEPLIEFLRDEAANVRQAAVEALGTIGDARAREPLLGILADAEENELVRSAVPAALADMADDAVFSALREAVGDDSRVLRSSVLIALRGIEYPLARAALLAALRGELLAPPPVEDGKATGETGEAGTEEHAVAKEAAVGGEEDEEQQGPQSTLEAIAQDNLRAEQAMAGTAETVISEDIPEDVKEFVGIAEENWRQIQSLEAETPAPHLDVRRFAARALAGCPGEDVVDALCACLEDEDADLRMQAVKSMGHTGDTRAIPRLLSLTGSDDSRLRVAVTRSLGQMRASEVREVGEALLVQLDDEDHFVRLAAAEALAYFQEEDVRSALRARLLQDGELGVRLACAKSLAAIGNEGDVEAIVQVAFLDEGEQRLEMGAILRHFHPDRGTGQLIAILNDPEREFYHRVAIEVLQGIHCLDEAA